MNQLWLWALLAILLKTASSAKILTIMTVPSPSHNFWFSRYLDALLRRDHHVTYVGFFTAKNPHPKLRHITFNPKIIGEVFKGEDFMGYTNVGAVPFSLVLDSWDHSYSKEIIKSEEFQKFLNVIKTEKFDLVIFDIAFTNFMMGALHVMKDTPAIGVTPYGQPAWILDHLKNPVLYASQPHPFLPSKDEMTFMERLSNYLVYFFSWATRYLYLVEQNKYAKDAFGEDVGSLEDLLNRLHLFLVNVDPIFDYPHPTPPGLIKVGGLHIEDPKPLPKDLQEYLDGAKHGVIYFSLGSNLMSSGLKKEKIEALNNAFKQLAPVRVLWKYEKDEFPFEKHSNVRVSKWLPQNDILAHPNVLLFFTHSGLHSTIEAVYHGVPILGMPFLMDQHINVRKCVEKGLGEQISFDTLTSEEVVQKIRKIIDDPKYRENAKRMSVLYQDQKESPLERAVYWTEYAIRHKGAPHLDLKAKKLSWYQNALIDVYLVIFAAIFLAIYIVTKIFKFLGSQLKGEHSKMKSS